MKSPQEARDAQHRAEAGQFLKYIRCLALAGEGGLPVAQVIAKESRAADRVLEVLKEAVAAGSTNPANWASPLVYEPMATAWLASNSYGSFLDTLLENAMPAAPHQPMLMVTGGGAVGSEVGEGFARPILEFSFELKSGISESTIEAITVVTADLLKMATPKANEMLTGELRRALRRYQDTAALAKLVPVGSPDPSIDSTGTTPAGAHIDLRNLLEEMALDANSRVVLGVSPTRALRMATWTHTDGRRAFPEMSFLGGVVVGVPVTVSDRIGDDEVVAVDASGVAGSAGTVVPSIATKANVQFETAPTEPTVASTVLISLWQRNMRALRLTRRFAIERVRENAVRKLAGVAWNDPA